MLEYDGIIYKSFVAKQENCFGERNFRAEQKLTSEELIYLNQVDISPHDIMQMGFFQIAIWFRNWMMGDLVSDSDGVDTFFPEVLL